MIKKASREVRGREFPESEGALGECDCRRFVFSPKVSAQIRQKRLELCASYIEVGRVLDVSWSTVRKWERGMVGGCRQVNCRKIGAFLAGEYDSEFGSGVLIGRNIPLDLQDIHRLFEQLMEVYGMSGHSPQIGKMIKRLLLGGGQVILHNIFDGALLNAGIEKLECYLQEKD